MKLSEALVILSVYVFSPALAIADTAATEADGFFEKGLYQKALTLYEKQKDNGDFRIFFRIQEAKLLLSRAGESAETLHSATPPKSPLDAARFYLLRTQASRSYLSTYRRQIPKDAEKGTQDVSRWTVNEWEERIEEDYFQLYALKQTLLERPIAAESYFLQTQDTDTELYPTLWDFAVFTWTEYLTKERSDTAYPSERDWENSPPARTVNPSLSAVELAAALWEESANAPGTSRELAREWWRLTRVFPHWLYGTKSEAFASKLESLLHAFRQPRSRAEAGSLAAGIYALGEKEEKAVSLCKEVEQISPTPSCRSLTYSLTFPEFDVEAFPVGSLKEKRVTLRTRNLSRVYLRLYPVRREYLEKAERPEGSQDWSHLRYIKRETAMELLKTAPAFETTLTPKPARPYASTESAATLPPALPVGLYVVLASDDPLFAETSRFLSGAVLNVTDVSLFASLPLNTQTGRSTLSLTVLSSQTGLPLPNASITVKTSRGEKAQVLEARSNLGGGCEVESKQNQVDPLVQSSQGLAYLPFPLWLRFSGTRNTLALRIDTDRQAYRPGQKVQARLTGYTGFPGSYQLASRATINAEVRDSNGKLVLSRKLTLSKSGSAGLTFTLPASKLLGRFTLSATGTAKGSNHTGSGSTDFLVEEYVRPDFEIVLQRPKQAIALHSKASLSGHSRYFSGAPLTQTPIHYRVFREPQIDVFPQHWHRRFPPLGPRTLVTSGETKTSDQGNFEIPFSTEVPNPSDTASPFWNFIVEVSARGPSGRTITAVETVTAAHSPLAVKAAFSQTFYAPTEKPTLSIETFHPERGAPDVKGRMRLWAVEEAPHRTPIPAHLTAETFFPLLQEAKATKEIQSLTFRTEKGKAVLALLPTAPGLYRAALSTKTDTGEEATTEAYLVIADPALPVSAVALSKKPEFAVGEIAEVLLGSADLKGKMLVEVWKADQRLSSQMLDGSVRIFKLPIKAEHRGGLTIRWFGVFDHRYRSGDVSLDVPWSDKKLHLVVSIPPTAKPGEKVRWSAQLRESNGTLADAEGMIRVFDRSLNSLAPEQPLWVDSLYGSDAKADPFQSSHAPLAFSWLSQYVWPAPEALAPAQRPPFFRSSASSGRMYRMMGLARSGVAKAASNSAETMVSASADTTEAASAVVSPPLRSDFRETAHFSPQWQFRKGKALIDFTFPDSMTDWKVSGYALDSHLRFATIESHVQTTQPFFGTLEAPRFFREKDQVEVVAVLHNTTSQKMSGSSSLSIRFAGAEKPVKTQSAFTIAPQSQTRVVFPISVPDGVGDAVMELSSLAGKLQDRSRLSLLQLPAKHRHVVSEVVALSTSRPSRIQLSIDKKSRLESVTLQIDPPLVSVLLNALPFVLQTASESATGLSDRYVSLGLLQHLFQSFPEHRKLISKSLRRRTQLAPWDRTDPRRLALIEETPWVLESEGLSTLQERLGEPGSIAALQKSTLAQLTALQTSEGGFAWLPGGSTDAFTTLYVLSRLAELRHFGIELPSALQEKALPYLQKQLPRWRELEHAAFPTLLLALRSMALLYPKAEWSETSEKVLEAVHPTLATLSPYAKGIVADLYYRKGDVQKGDEALETALDGARESAWGTYWSPEKASWNQNYDTLEKHCFFLRLLLEWKPTDPRVAGMVKWVLFNRKASQWKSTRHSVTAVLSLLDYRLKHTSLLSPQRIEWDWANKHETVSIRPNQAAPSPLKWTLHQPDRSALDASFSQKGNGETFVSLTAVAASSTVGNSSSGPLSVRSEFFLRAPNKTGNFDLTLLSAGSTLRIGDEVEQAIVLTAESPLEYVQVRTPRAAGMEPAERTSGWQWNPLALYHEIRDTSDSAFISLLPKGEVTLRRRFLAQTAGEYCFGPTQAQSVYSPDISALNEGFRIRITP
jgi:alpha-2-macroglobulin